MISRRVPAPVIGVLDQGMSAASNLLVALAVARAVDGESFGSFTLALMVYSSALIIGRALISEPFVVLSMRDPELSQGGWPRLLGIVAALGLVMGTATSGVLGAIPSADVSRDVVVVVVALPVLLGQDFLRWVAIARQRPEWALGSDATWVLLFVTTLVIVPESWPPTLCWAAGGAAGLVFLLVLVRRDDRRRVASRPARSTRTTGHREVVKMGLPAAGEIALGALGLQIGFYCAAALIGTRVVGEVRGALLLLGPLGVLASGIGQTLIVRYSQAEGSVRWHLLRLQGALAMTCLAAGLALIHIPTALGEQMLGATWSGARHALPPMTVYTACVLALVLGQLAVRARRESKRLFRYRRFDVVLIPVIFTIGAWWGETTYLWSIVVTGVIDLAMVLVVLRKASLQRA